MCTTERSTVAFNASNGAEKEGNVNDTVLFFVLRFSAGFVWLFFRLEFQPGFFSLLFFVCLFFLSSSMYFNSYDIVTLTLVFHL